ncbi:MAG TPA: DNA polymerase III subunit delta' [Clostridia bacterium]|nr:DNA polymerase III subunit delta' [Clostridia bacterium]
MGFSEFHGNAEVVGRLREMLARDRFPHAVILTGPRGAGKYTLAQMVAKAMNCLNRPQRGELFGGGTDEAEVLPDFCGECTNCVRIAQADRLEERCAEAVEARENLRETDKKETRILIQTHPEVLVIPPDPPQMMIKVDQVRHVTANIYYRPAEGGHRVFIFTDAAFMKEAANALLKVLEEPPDYATIFLLAENATALLPTIRSRCITLHLAPLPAEEIERDLAHRIEWNPKQRALVARLAAGAVGRARSFDLNAYLAARNDALTLLRTALNAEKSGRGADADHSALFRTTESYRAGAEGKGKTDQMISTLYNLLQDIMFLKSKTPDLVRNIDIAPELEAMAQSVDFGWISRAADRVGDVQTGMRRNLLRSLSLDALAFSLETE